MKKRILPDLLFTFMKIGLFTFGGGYAMISIIENCCVEEKMWISHDDMMNITVVAESTPGPIAINCATFVGYQKADLPGAVTATLGIILPSFAVIYLISMFLDRFLEITVIAHAFKGIKIAIGILILDGAVTMLKKMKKKRLSLLIMASSFTAMSLINIFSWNFSSITLMVTAGILSLLVFLTREAGGQKGGRTR